MRMSIFIVRRRAALRPERWKNGKSSQATCRGRCRGRCRREVEGQVRVVQVRVVQVVAEE